jgi:hypothetical protein
MTSSAAAMWMADGIESLLLWLMLTWSFACTGEPSALVASRAITSFAFMFELVPEPVWNTSIGKCSSCMPFAISSALDSMAAAMSSGNRPKPRFVRAAAHFTSASARTNAGGMRKPLIGKLFTARCVCAPHNADAGTCSSPMLSRSTRKSAAMPTPKKLLEPATARTRGV